MREKVEKEENCKRMAREANEGNGVQTTARLSPVTTTDQTVSFSSSGIPNLGERKH